MKKLTLWLVIPAFLVLPSCAKAKPHSAYDDPDKVRMQDNAYCYTYAGISFYAEEGAACLPLDTVKRDVDFDIDYTKEPDDILNGEKVIFTAREQLCGLPAWGCTEPMISLSEVDTENGQAFTRAVLRHELYHVILWRAGKDASDVGRDEQLHPMRKDWFDIETGPL